MEKSKRKSIILTAIISSVLSITLFVSVILAFDNLDNSAKARVDGDTIQELQHEIDIIDESGVLTADTESYIRETVFPLANKHFDVEFLDFYYNELSEDNVAIVATFYVTNESIGRILSEKYSLNEDYENEIDSHKEEMSHNIMRVSELLNLKFDTGVNVAFRTTDLERTVFINASPYAIKRDVLGLTQ